MIRRAIWMAVLLASMAAGVFAYEAPFRTSSEVVVYYTDTHGLVLHSGGPVLFSYPNIRAVRADGKELEIARKGPDWVLATLPDGTYEIRVEGDPTGKVASRANEPRGPIWYSDKPLVATLDAFKQRVASAGMMETIVIKNGDYFDWKVAVPCKGTEGKPVIIRPETPGGVRFHGETRIVLTGEHIVLKGFDFEETGLYSVKIQESSGNRVTQCHFYYCGSPTSTFSHIVNVGLKSNHNRVDHCYWTGSRSMSLGLTYSRKVNPADVGVHNRFDHNIFRDIYRLWVNGQENIQLGSGYPWAGVPHTIIEYNLFDYAWGDGEIISDKTTSNTIRYNVMANCVKSALTLRGGDYTRVEGNIFTGNADGMRVYGKYHTIVNNLFLGNAGAAISLSVGHDSGRGSHGVPATGCLIANNTMVGNSMGIATASAMEREDWTPCENDVVNNIFVASWGTHNDPNYRIRPKARDNLFWTDGSAQVGFGGEGALEADPMLVGDGAAMKPAPASPAVDRAIPLPQVALDRLGNKRPIGKGPDLGADEVGGTAKEIARLMPHVPKLRHWDIGLYKGEQFLDYDPAKVTAAWKGAPAPAKGIVEMRPGHMTWSGKLPDDFVAEFEYQPDAFGSTAAVVFGGTPDKPLYTITWGGLHEEGKAPSGLIHLYKGHTQIAEMPDPVYYYLNYRFVRYLGRTTIGVDKPIPALWYHVRLLAHKGTIRLILNHATPTTSGSSDYDMPVIVWKDRGTIEGPAATGGGLSLMQAEGAGRWRNMRIWRAEYTGDRPPAAPANLRAEATGAERVTLQWDAPDGLVFDVFRDTQPGFAATNANRIAAGILGRRFDDFAVEPNTAYIYQVRAANILGLASVKNAETSVVTTTGGPETHAIDAMDFASIEPPITVSTDQDSGHFVWLPRGAGRYMKGPPEKGFVEYVVTIRKAGTYRIWGRSWALGSSSDSFYFQIDGSEPKMYATGSGAVWRWSRIGPMVKLDAGQHRIRLRPRESGTKLRGIVVTADTRWAP